jgi:hypothetical protein
MTGEQRLAPRAETVEPISRFGGVWPAGEVDKIGLVSPIAKQAFVGRLLSGLWFQWLSGFPLRDLSVGDFLGARDDVLLARAGSLSFCLSRFHLLRHQIEYCPNSETSVLISRT